MSSPDQSPNSPPSPANADATVECPSCHAQAIGKFCSSCGGPLAGATCNACGAPLTPGAKFCHRCGASATSDAQAAAPGGSSALPWGIAAIALVALIALVAGQRFARSSGDTQALAPADTAAPVAPFAGASGGRPPDLSSMTPEEMASRLYDRVMSQHERGRDDSVAVFAPMAIMAYQRLGPLNVDQHYDLGRIAAVSGDEGLARAESDTILSKNPNHLLGLVLAANAAHLRKDTAAESKYRDKLKSVVTSERAKQLPEYAEHENDITIALDAKRP